LSLRAETTTIAFPGAETITVGPARNTTEKVTLTVGHATLTFSGRWSPLLQGQKVIGLYLSGLGGIDYTSTFEPEHPVFTRNLKEWTGVTPTISGNAVSAGFFFREARVLLGGVAVPTWSGDPAESMGDAYKAFAERLEKMDRPVPLHLMAMQSSNAPEKQAAVMDFEQDGNRWVYTYDGVDSMEESLQSAAGLTAMYPGASDPDLLEWRWLVELSRQPVGWDPRKGLTSNHFIMTALDVDLRTKDNRNVEMVAQETIVPLENGLQVLRFHLTSWLNLEKGSRHLRVARVTDGEGHALGFHHRHDELAVHLATPSIQGVPLILKVEYGGDFLYQPGEDSYWQLGVRGSWYPMPENMASEAYIFHGTVRTAGDWIAFLPGDTIRREKDGTWNLVETRTTKPICFATILGGKYYIDEETHDGLTVRIATYGFKPGVANKVFKAQAFNVISFYQTFLGPFPFKEFTIIEKNEWGYGQAPPSMMYITRDAFEQLQTAKQMQDLATSIEQARRNGWKDTGSTYAFKAMDVRHVFAHEIAHQYWGIEVKMPSHLEQWITESFADYCSALFERDMKGNSLFEKRISGWKSEASDSSGKAPIPLANQIYEKEPYARFYTRRNLLYAKGPVLLNALHNELGDQVFLTWLKSIQTNFRWKFATTRQLFDLLSFITKKDYKPFYNDYYWGLATPGKKP
jgi:hypothetical protein